MSDYKTITLSLRSPKGAIVGGMISVRNGWAIAVFSDPKLTEQIYKEEKKAGKRVHFDKEKGAMIEEYPSKSRDQIVEILQAELKKSGATQVRVK